MSVENKAGPPQWFTRAIEDPGEDCFVNVEGCRIHYLRWGQAGKPGLVFLHGGFAHAHWWDFIAPFFAEDYSVVAIDLSGVYDLEYTALKMLIEGEKSHREGGVWLWLVGLNPQVLAMVQRSPLGEILGRERMHFTLEVAIDKYLASLATDKTL